MAKVKSNLSTSVSYDGREGNSKERARRKVTLVPGVNELTDDQMATLDKDSFFKKHAAAGHYVVLDAQSAPPAEAPPPPAPDPRARLPGEKDNAYKKRMAALDKAEEDAAKEAEKAAKLAQTVTDFMALDEENQTALYATLSDEEKQAVDEARKEDE